MPAAIRSRGDTTELVYEYVRSHVRRHGRAPTVRELCCALEISSTSVVLYHLRQLVKAGRIERDLGIPRGIVLADAITVFVGDEVLVEVDGELVLGRVVEPAQAAA